MVQVLKNNEKNAAKISTCKIIDCDDVTYDNNKNIIWSGYIFHVESEINI